jgi:hypothetical protein
MMLQNTIHTITSANGDEWGPVTVSVCQSSKPRGFSPRIVVRADGIRTSDDPRAKAGRL